MCKNIVGTENHVKTIRLLNAVCDNLSCDDHKVSITSGSFGEGLQLRGSDLDIMNVSKYIEVHDDITSIVFKEKITYFSLMTKDTKPGFAMLRLLRSPHPKLLECCEKFRGSKYLSNVLFKKMFLSEFVYVVHGPCISDPMGHLDFAFCLHCKNWVSSASQWIMRSNNSWPSENTKQNIINHGVLFVPVGAKGSPHEELEWRISFSVGEKFLIYTFSHTQLLCYVLMKILLKDVINSDSRCKNLLCSYYLKTIIFWISEELQPCVWTSDNLIPCFIRCFRRLIYCVQYQVCPHYFIPENNMFENKIEGLDRANLIDTLRVLVSCGWRCILFSKQIFQISVLSCNVQNNQSIFNYEDISKLLKSNVFLRVTSVSGKHDNFSKAVYNIVACNSKKLKYFYAYFMSVVSNKKCQSVYLGSTIGNKNQYKQHNKCLSYLLMNINHDTVSGWLMLASFFYKENQYKQSLLIILYAFSKCTLEKIVFGTELPVTHQFLVKWLCVQRQGVVRLFTFLMAFNIFFEKSTFIPMELLIDEKRLEIPPIVYAHFLSFLCHRHLNNVRECRNSLRDLQLTIAEGSFIGKDTGLKALSYYCLGTALQLMEDNASAKQAFTETVKLFPYPYPMRGYNRLSMIASV